MIAERESKMFCKNCGTSMNDNAAFCPSCGAASTPQFSQAEQTQQGVPLQYGQPSQHQGMPPAGQGFQDAKTLLAKGVTGVSAVIFAVLALMCLVKIFDNVEGVIAMFGSYDGIVSAVGTIGFIACGVLLAGFAALAALPLVRGILDNAAFNQGAIDRSMVLGITFTVLCLIVWICKLVFNSPAGGDVSAVLYHIFSIFGATAVDCIIPAVIALAVLYIARTKIFVQRAL